MLHLLENNLTLNGLIEISSQGTTCGYIHYNDGETIEIYEDVEYLEEIKEYLEKYNLLYEVRCTQTGDILNEDYHQECVNDEDYDNSWHHDWRIKIIGYSEKN